MQPVQHVQQSQTAEESPALADTGGGVDTTPYLLGGTACLGIGAGFVAFSLRRPRTGGSAAV